MRGKWRAQRADRGAHAARGFVGGAPAVLFSRKGVVKSFNAARGFVGGAAIMLNWIKTRLLGFNAARGFVGGAARQCRQDSFIGKGFNAARGFVGGAAELRDPMKRLSMLFQCRTRLCGWCSSGGFRC